MNNRSKSARFRSSFFHREPKFSVLIVALSLLVLISATVMIGFDIENPFSSFFCHQSIEKFTKVDLPKIRDFFEQITNGLGLMPR